MKKWIFRFEHNYVEFGQVTIKSEGAKRSTFEEFSSASKYRTSIPNEELYETWNECRHAAETAVRKEIARLAELTQKLDDVVTKLMIGEPGNQKIGEPK